MEKPLRKAVKKYVRIKRDDPEDQEMTEVQIAEDESVERYILTFLTPYHSTQLTQLKFIDKR